MKKNIEISLELAKSLLGKSDEMDALIKANFSASELNVLPKRWEDIGVLNGFYINGISDICAALDFEANERNKSILPTKQLAEAMLAMCQLLYLRDIYRQGWIPDYNDSSQNKFGIYFFKNCLTTNVSQLITHTISFQSTEIAEQFLENFRDLLETAKELL